jgi:dienelactone hydrolase
MKSIACSGAAAVMVLVAVAVVSAARAQPTHVQPPTPEPYAYVSFRVAGDGTLTVAGRLTLPNAAPRPMPAVVIVHGSGGVDSRLIDYAEALQRAGIGTLEIDMWSARWPQGGPLRRPRGVPETLPDAYGALAFLAAHEAIDKSRIGVLGFSWGGVVAMLTATRAYTERFAPPGLRFAAHAPFYPVCWVYNKVPGYDFRELTGAAVLINAAELDDYDRPDTCAGLVAGLPPSDRRTVELQMAAGATHAFDRRGPDMSIVDPFAHLGKGGEVRIRYNAQQTERARAAVVEFFRRELGVR